MNAEELLQILKKGESESVEFSRAFDKTDKMGQAICAFANDLSGSGEVGRLFLGVDNDGKISGKKFNDELFASIGGLKTDGALLPPPSMVIEKHSFQEGDVVAISVYPSRYTPIRYKGQVWVRVGPRKCIANEADLHILNERNASGAIRDELKPCLGSRIDDLEISLFKDIYLPRAVAAEATEDDERSAIEQMAALKFFDLERQCPTNAGMLLFGRHPERYIPGAYIQYVKFESDDNAGSILLEHAFRGPLARTVFELETFIKTGPAGTRPVFVSAMQEAQVAQYPSKALRELILNAVIHRDYFIGNAPAKFYEYASGRIEISNPGGLFGLANAGNFPFMNDYRNPLIAESMRVLGMVNKFNRGIAIVKQDLEHNGNPPAVFDVNKMTEFRVTINAKKSGEINRESGEINRESGEINRESGEINRESGEIKYNTVRNDSVVLEIIRRNPGIKREKIFLELRTSIRSVERALARLKADKVIEYRGSNKTGGWYIRT